MSDQIKQNNDMPIYFDMDWGWRYLYQWGSLPEDSISIDWNHFQGSQIPYSDMTEEKGKERFNNFFKKVLLALQENLRNISTESIDNFTTQIGWLLETYPETEDSIKEALKNLLAELAKAKYRKARFELYK